MVVEIPHYQRGMWSQVLGFRAYLWWQMPSHDGYQHPVLRKGV